MCSLSIRSLFSICLVISLEPTRAGLAQSSPQKVYYVYVCAESDDEVALVRFGRGGTEVVKTIEVGRFPAEIEGPHGINVSPSGKYWYLSIAHGFPFGSIHKFSTGTDEHLGEVTVGMFPATLDIAPSTGLLYVVNFNLHGPMEPSTISVIETATMLEVAQVPTGVMPHGARLNAKGTRLYSVNMMDDELIEMDAYKFKIKRRLLLATGKASGRPAMKMSERHPGPIVQPTWASRPTRTGKLYIPGNKNNILYEIDLSHWTISREFKNAGKGPYNLAVTPDAKTLVVTYKKGQSIGIWDLEVGAEAARIKTTRAVPHGVVISRDGRYAFASIEGVGGEPGAVEVYDLVSTRRVGAVDMGKQAGGIAFWKSER